MLHLHPGEGSPDALFAALRASNVQGTRLVRKARGMANAGAHIASLDVRCDDSAAEASAISSVSALVAELGDAIDAVGSVVLVGHDVDFLPCGPQPIRYSYLMRRRHDFTHERYLTRYHDVHSRFGFATPGIEGYTQFHVDPAASAAAAATIGVGVSDFDSVSELHIASLDTFFAALTAANLGPEATEDEEQFVDRPNSWDYLYDVDLA